jgi:O-antigen ligase
MSGDMISLISLAFFAVLGIVFLLFNKTFSEAVSESRLLTLLLFEGLGIPKDVFRASEKNCGYLIPILFGSFFGGLVYFVPPSFYFAAIATLILISLVIYMPEIGVVALFSSQAVAGFFPNPTVFAFAMIAVTTISFALKLIRGKRVFKLMFLDFSVLLFLTIRLFSGLFGVGGVEAFLQACVSSALMLGYFLTANLVNSQKWLNRTMGAFAVFSVLAAVVGVYQYFSGGFESGWLDASAFSGIKVRVTSLFDNPNSYGAYLLLVIPFLFSGINESKSIKGKWIYGSVLILSSFCIVQTWSRGAWVALIAELLAYYLVTSRKTVPALVSGLGAVTLLVCLFAPNVSSRILSIGNLSESSVSYRISAWKGIIDMMRAYWIGGIGYGEAAFISVYSRYAYSGASNLRHSHNLFLQILVECGAVGGISFSIFLFSFFCCCFEYLKMKGPGRRSSVIAGMSAVFGTAVMGMTDYVWYNSRVFLAFWLAVGFTVACIRNGWAERERVEVAENNSRFSADIELDSDNL